MDLEEIQGENRNILEGSNKMNNDIKELFKNFKKRPVAFIGSGLSKRYLNSPTWEELLKNCFKVYNDNDAEFGLLKINYKNNYPKIAYLIEKDFNYYFVKNVITKSNKELYNIYFQNKQLIDSGSISPLKLYISYKLKDLKTNEIYKQERLSLTSFLNKCANIITTNYDELLEHNCDYSTIVGHNKLILDECVGYGEIYKIHGSVSDPNSLILTEDDYNKFNDKKSFYHARLLLSFIEQPIIFIGYSITDNYILNILSDVDSNLTDRQKNILATRIIFIDYSSEANTPKITVVREKNISMTKITTNNFKMIYELATNNITPSLPVSILKTLQESIKNLIYSQNNKDAVPVIKLSDASDNIRAIYIGENYISDNSSLFKPIDLLNDIIFEDSRLPSYDSIIEIIYKEKSRFQRDAYIPLYKYFYNSKYNTVNSNIEFKNLTNIKIENIFKNSNDKYHIKDITKIREYINPNEEDKSLMYLLYNLKKIQVDDLVEYLKLIHPEHFSGKIDTKYRKIICYIDYLKHKK